MKPASSDFVYFLENNSTFLMADCFTFNLVGGTVLRYTSADVNVNVDGTVYIAHSVLVSGLKYTISAALDVDEQAITIAARDADTVDGVPFLVALRTGAFDGCYVQRDRAFLSAWGTPAIGSVILFYGRISTIDKVGARSAEVKVKSNLVFLAQDFPRNIYQPSCLHTFCDVGCGLSKSTMAVDGGADGGDYSNVLWPEATAGVFDQGTIRFESGANADVTANIKSSTGGSLVLSYPLEFPVAEGDAFTAYRGCAHTLAACQGYSNDANFRGFPFVPTPETAY